MSLFDFLKDTKLINRKIETKAANLDGQLGISIISGLTTDTNNIELTPSTLMQYNKNYVYVCNNKNAMMVATTPLKLYYKKNISEKILNPHKQIKKSIVELKSQEDLVEIVDHPIKTLLDTINENMNYTDFVSYVQQYLGLIGNAYVKIEKNSDNTVKALYPLISENVSLVLNNGVVTGYKYNNRQTYGVDEILHLINYAPGMLVAGKGELEYCYNASLRYSYYDQLENALNSNNARPDFAIIYQNQLKENNLNDVRKAWYKRFGSAKNAGKPFITDQGAKIQQLGLAPKDMEYENGRKWCKNEILAVFGVPEALVDLNSANLASSRSATQHYFKFTIIPKLTQFCERLNEKLVPLFDDSGKLFLWFDYTETGDPIEESAVLKTYVDAGIMTIDEARAKIGLNPLKQDNAINQLEA